MKRRAIFAILLAAPLFAHQFEVASIKPFDPSAPGKVAFGMHFDGAQVRAIGLSLRDLLEQAYKIKATLISGPDWTATERFDISAVLPAGSTTAQLPEMLQALLADRFQVKVHKDKKELPAYALLVGKGGLKMKESPPDSDPDKDQPKGTVNVASSGVGVNYGHGTSFTFANNRFEAHKLRMTLFSEILERYADRRIVDMTGLTGQYDFAFDVTPEDYRAMLIRAAIAAGVVLQPETMHLLDASSPAALGDALQQIGLRLDARKAPLDVLVIDDALKTPIAN